MRSLCSVTCMCSSGTRGGRAILRPTESVDVAHKVLHAELDRKRLMPSDGGSQSHRMLGNGSFYGVVECGPMAGACKFVTARRRSCAQSCARASTRTASTAGRNLRVFELGPLIMQQSCAPKSKPNMPDLHLIFSFHVAARLGVSRWTSHTCVHSRPTSARPRLALTPQRLCRAWTCEGESSRSWSSGSS